MDPTNITFLNHLDVSNDEYTIKVRIIKLWRQHSFKVPGDSHAIEMILMDKQGNKIQATVLNKYFGKFEKLLEEKACLLIKKPSLGDNMSAYKCVDHPHKLFLNFNSTVKKCIEFVGSVHGFSLTSFDMLRDNLIPDDSIVGCVTFLLPCGSRMLRKWQNTFLRRRMVLLLLCYCNLEDTSFFQVVLLFQHHTMLAAFTLMMTLMRLQCSRKICLPTKVMKVLQAIV